MEIDFSQVLVGPDRKILTWKETPQSEETDYQLVDACTAALLDGSQQCDGAEKHRRYKLWAKLVKGPMVDLSVEQLKLLRDCVGKHATPLICGQIWDILDGGGAE